MTAPLRLVSVTAGPFDGLTAALDPSLPRGTYIARQGAAHRKPIMGRFRDGPLPAWAEIVDLGPHDFAAVGRGLLPDGLAR